MTIPPTQAVRGSRTRWLEIAAAVWLLLISALALINGVGLARLDDQTKDTKQPALVESLRQRVADLEQHADADKRRPAPMSQTDFVAARQALDQRIARLEESQRTSAAIADLQTLQARVIDIEGHLQKTPPTTLVRSRAPVSTKPTVADAPFRILGVEIRGGERFLLIAPVTSTSLVDTRLLREGDVDSRWQLQSIEAKAAVFQIDGQTRRLPVP